MKWNMIIHMILVSVASIAISFVSHAYSGDIADISEIYQYVYKGDYDAAIPLLRKYNSQYKDRVDGIILLGQIYLSKGDFNARDYAEAVFKEGLARDPENTILLQYLSEINRKRGMIEAAQYYLKKSIEIDPNNPEALDQLMMTYIVRQNSKGLEELLTKVEEWNAAYPDSTRGYMTLGKIQLALDRGKEAIEVLRKGLEVNLTYSPLYRLLAEAYLVTGNVILFTESYYYWLTTTNDPEDMTLDFQLAELAMSEEDQLEFTGVAPLQQAGWLAEYWKKQDPNPVTIQNERLVEHFRRINYAQQNFRTSVSPLGFDDRGKIYIKWGPPEEKYANPMPSLSPGYSDIINVNGMLVDPADTMGMRGNESWYYPSIDYYMAFDFVNFGGYYREAISLTDAVIGKTAGIGMSLNDPGSAKDYNNWIAIQSIYEERAHLGGIYAGLANCAVDDLPRNTMIDVPSEKARALRHAVPRYELDSAIPPLKFEVLPVQFRGDSGLTRVELAYGLPLDQLEPVPRHDTTFTFTFQNDLVVFDSTRLRILHRQFSQKKTCPPGLEYKDISFTGESVCSLLPGNYEVAFQSVEISNKKGKYNTYPMDIRDFNGTGLMISDLKLSPKMEFLGVDKGTGMDRLNILPYPFRYIMREYPLYVYFEIYNLGISPHGNSDFEISLKMERETKKGEYAIEAVRSFGRIFTGGKAESIETIYQRSGKKQMSQEQIELDLTGIEAEHSRLTVTVRDLVMNTEVANSVEFNIRKEKK